MFDLIFHNNFQSTEFIQKHLKLLIFIPCFYFFSTCAPDEYCLLYSQVTFVHSFRMQRQQNQKTGKT